MNKKIFISALISLMAFVLVASTLAPTVFAQTTPTPTVSLGQKPALLNRAKDLAEKIFDTLFLNKLNALRARVSANTKLSVEQKQVLLARIDTEITWFTAKKGELTNANSVSQIRQIIREARTHFQEIARDLRHLYLARGYIVSLEKVIENIENNIIPKVEAKLSDLKSKGVDVTSELGDLMKAKTALANAKIEITQVKNSTTFENAKKHFDAAKEYIKTARQELKKILVSLKDKV